jgi:hypothetical protein
MKLLARLPLAALAVLVAAVTLAAGTVTGVVQNGTTGTPAAGVEVILIGLQGNMESLATTHADAQGRYSFDRPEIGKQPLLLRAVYRGVFYHEPLPPGHDTADIEVYEPTQDPKALQVSQHTIIFQPNGAQLLVGEEYTIRNQTHPPVAYYKEGGTFEFVLPQGAQLSQVAAWGPSGMPVVQGTIDKGANRYGVSFPFRPGENGVRFSYDVPYASDHATLKVNSLYAAGHIVLAAPPSVTVSSEGFTAAGAQQGWNLYTREGGAVNAPVVISVSGTAPPPSASAGGNQNSGQGSSAGATSSSGGGGDITVVPARLTGLRWILIGGFGLLFLLGIAFLLRRPRAKPAVAPAAAGVSPAPSGVTGQVDREVRASVEEIKETLFRLELRRQAGTLSEEDYTRERNRAEKALRDLVRG